MSRLVGYGVSQVPTNGMLGGMAYQDPTNVSVNILRVGPPGGNFQPGNGNNSSLTLSGIFTGSYTSTGSLSNLYNRATVLGIANDAGVTESNAAIIGFSCLNTSGYNSQGYFGVISTPSSEGDLGRGATFVLGQRSGNSYVERIRITRTGNIGIGSTSPTQTVDINGVVAVSAGSTSAPSITPTGDSNTGIFFPSADTIAFAEGGAEAARIDSSGRLLLGTSTARTDLTNGNAPAVQIEKDSTTSGILLSAIRNSNDVYSGSILLGKTRGSIGSNTVVQSGDWLGYIGFAGADGTNIEEGAAIKAEVDGTPGTNDMPGRLVFSTTSDGASSPTERLRIDSSGRLLLGTQTVAGSAALQIVKSSGDALLVRNGDTNYEGFLIQNSSGFTDILATSGGSTSRPGMRFFTNDTARMQIALNGQRSSVLASGSTLYLAYDCRAWVNFSGTGSTGANQSIRGSGNVSSVFKNGGGNYTMNFTNAMADANYCIAWTVGSETNHFATVSSSSAAVLRTGGADPTECFAAIFR